MIEVDFTGANAIGSLREFQTYVSILYVPDFLGTQD
jgi:hypothetical protein